MEPVFIIIGIGAFVVLCLFTAVISAVTSTKSSRSNDDLSRIRLIKEIEFMDRVRYGDKDRQN